MFPSYPNWEWESDLSIRFFAPTKRAVYKILEDSEEEDILRKKAAGIILCSQVKGLAQLLLHHPIRIESVTPNELEIIMSLASQPVPRPKRSPVKNREKLQAYKPQLDTIEEVSEEHTRSVAELRESSSEEMDDLHKNMSGRKRYATYTSCALKVCKESILSYFSK